MSQLSAIAGVPVADDAARHDQAIGMSVIVDPGQNLYSVAYASLRTGLNASADIIPLASKNDSFVMHKPN